jgi:hypothetical protein
MKSRADPSLPPVDKVKRPGAIDDRPARAAA